MGYIRTRTFVHNANPVGGGSGPAMSASVLNEWEAAHADASTRLDDVEAGFVRSAATTSDQRLAARTTPTFTAGFTYSTIAPNQDGFLVWKNMNIAAGSASVAAAGGAPSYFKAVGGNINHTGPGNLDVFWSSVAHSGAREAGLFIGDITGTNGGNLYGVHTRLILNTTPANIVVGYENEIQPNVARGPGQFYYNFMVQNSGTVNASAAIQIESPSTGGGGKFDKGINFDTTAASLSGTAMFIGGVWGAGVDMNNNAIVNVGSISGNGATGARFVRIADWLTLDNARSIGFRDTTGTRRDTLAVTSTDDVALYQTKAAGNFLFRDFANATSLAQITSTGRGAFAGGVTSKYSTGATQPGYVTNGQIEVWQDTTNNISYLVVNVNGASKKVAVT